MLLNGVGLHVVRSFCRSGSFMIWHVMASHCVMVFLAPSVVMIVADVTFRNQDDVPYFIFFTKS